MWDTLSEEGPANDLFSYLNIECYPLFTGPSTGGTLGTVETHLATRGYRSYGHMHRVQAFIFLEETCRVCLCDSTVHQRFFEYSTVL